VRTVRSIAEVRTALEPRERTIGLVPTMGAFHEGHLALFRRARAECDTVVASLFVNPAQFGPAEDLARYPRDERRDAALAEAEGVDLLFVPDVEEIYPPGFQTWVEVEQLARILEGRERPGHFRGVATVCLKLFSIVRPRYAYFGQKDAQQVAVLQRLAADLALELEIRVVPTVREPDGLALSSRNVYLTAADRQAALAIPRALEAGAAAHRDGGDPASAARGVLAAEPAVEPQYVEVARLGDPLVLAIAARVGATRLIDNVVLEGAAA
jgi:pantoate--beta-alanine ligase